MAASLSRLFKTVWLSDWWLIWANNENHEKKLAIAGFISRGQKALQTFSSAPIRKRYDVFTLETTDGIYVLINGFMNKARTVENGFPYEVSDHFLFGFPPHWEACAEKYLQLGFASNDVSRVDASLKDLSTENERTYEKSFSREHLGHDGAYLQLNEDHTGCMVHKVSKKSDKALRYITSHGGVTNTDRNKAAYDENVTGENVSPASADPKLNENHTGCMIQEGSKKSANAVRYITSDGATNTDRNETASHVKETSENVSPACADPKPVQDHGICITRKTSKKSDKAVKCVTSAGGVKNTDRKETAVVKETGENASPAGADPKLNQDHTVRVCMIQDDLENMNTAIRYLTTADGAKNTNCKETAAVEKESVGNVRPTSADPELNEDGVVTVCMIQKCSKKSSTVVRFPTSAGGAQNTDHKKASSFEKETTEYVSPADADPILDQDRTVCTTQKHSKKSKNVRDVSTVVGSKDPMDREKTAAIVEEIGENVNPSSADPEMEDHTVCMTNEGSKKSNKAARYVTRARKRDCKEIEVTTVRGSKDCKETAVVVEKTVENVSPSGADPRLDQDHTVCTTRDGSKKYNKAARYITRVSGGRNRDRKKTEVTTLCGSKHCKETAAVVEKTVENVSPSAADLKLDQDHIVCTNQEGSKNSNKASLYITRASGGRNRDCKKTEAVGNESSFKERITAEEASTPGKTTKRKLRYGSPITPKVDEITSVVSAESLSTKKSRSGRLLLPTLEYWRNQTAVYDADHQVVGIKQRISTPSKVEVTHEPKLARETKKK